MQRKIQRFLPLKIWVFVAAGFICTSSLVPASASSRHRIFILHSYEQNHVCGQPQHDGVVAALREAGFQTEKNLEVKIYYMDTKRKNNTSELIEKQSSIALDQIMSFRPNVLVALDDNAFRTVALRLVDSDIAIVFSGLNGQPEDYNLQRRFMNSRKNPGHNVTGVYEKLHINDAIRVHSRIFPNLRKVKIIVDQSPTGVAIAKQIKLELQHEPTPCAWQITAVKNWEDYRKEIYAANRDFEVGAIYPAALLLKDSEGNSYTAPEIFKWTNETSKKPEIPLNYAFTRLGLFGGAAVDFYSMGQQAGKMVAKIIKGEKPGNIAIEEAERYALVFNLIRAQQLRIDIPEEFILAADEVIAQR